MDAMNAIKLLTYLVASDAKCFFALTVLMPTISESIFILLIAGVVLWVAILDWVTRHDQKDIW
jgi:hypothetical protein